MSGHMVGVDIVDGKLFYLANIADKEGARRPQQMNGNLWADCVEKVRLSMSGGFRWRGNAGIFHWTPELPRR